VFAVDATRLIVMMAVAAATLANRGQTQGVPHDSVFRVRMVSPVTSRTAKPDDPVEATLFEYAGPDRGVPLAARAPNAFTIPAGARVVGHVVSARAADRAQHRIAKLQLVFTDVHVDGTTSYRIDAHVLIPGQGLEQDKGVISVKDRSRTDWAEPFIFGVPLGAGVGVMTGRNGKGAAIGAAAVFSWLYLRPLIGTTGNPFDDVELKPGHAMVLHTR
jgi:hypothetical protein